MSDPREGALIVLYDGECGFCAVMLAVLLRWDRAHRLDAAPIQGARGERLLGEMPPEERLKSWHVIDGAGAVHSGGSGVPVALAVLPGGVGLARVASQIPGVTSRAYEWVADHRATLGRLLPARSRAWAARVIAARGRSAPRGTVP
jgi:predicted DCC family thiol-disulfide oxidoreductase YuxK